MPAIVLAGAAMVGAGCFYTVYKIKAKKTSKTYFEEFQKAYGNYNDVMMALDFAKYAFPDGSKQEKAISAAIFYVRNSIMHDYEGAFRRLEKTFHGKEVRDLHNSVLQIEKGKKNALLFLEVKN